jgi:hypothetical protein
VLAKRGLDLKNFLYAWRYVQLRQDLRVYFYLDFTSLRYSYFTGRFII